MSRKQRDGLEPCGGIDAERGHPSPASSARQIRAADRGRQDQGAAAHGSGTSVRRDFPRRRARSLSGRIDRSHTRGPCRQDQEAREGRGHRYRRRRDRRRAAQPGGGREVRRARARGQGGAPHEGQPALGRAAGRGRQARDGPAHRPPHQPRLHHGRADAPPDALHHRRRREHRAGPDGQARHRAERHRSLQGSRARHAQGRDPLGRRDRDGRHPLHHRGRRAVQDGRPRPDHRRRARWPACLRQCHQPRGRRDQGHQVAGRRPGADPGRAGPRGRQHAGQEPVVPVEGGCGRHRARRPRSRHPDVARRQREDAAGVLRRRLAARPQPKVQPSRSGREPDARQHPRRQRRQLEHQVPAVRRGRRRPARAAHEGADGWHRLASPPRRQGRRRQVASSTGRGRRTR